MSWREIKVFYGRFGVTADSLREAAHALITP